MKLFLTEPIDKAGKEKAISLANKLNLKYKTHLYSQLLLIDEQDLNNQKELINQFKKEKIKLIKVKEGYLVNVSTLFRHDNKNDTLLDYKMHRLDGYAGGGFSFLDSYRDWSFQIKKESLKEFNNSLQKIIDEFSSVKIPKKIILKKTKTFIPE